MGVIWHVSRHKRDKHLKRALNLPYIERRSHWNNGAALPFDDSLPQTLSIAAQGRASSFKTDSTTEKANP